jgi:hypothetical protein
MNEPDSAGRKENAKPASGPPGGNAGDRADIGGGPEDAKQDEDTVLFKILGRRADGRTEVHLSCGMAAHLPMTQQTIDAIRAALELAEEAGPPAARSQVFYTHLCEHAPEFANMIRQP